MGADGQELHGPSSIVGWTLRAPQSFVDPLVGDTELAPCAGSHEVISDDRAVAFVYFLGLIRLGVVVSTASERSDSAER